MANMERPRLPPARYRRRLPAGPRPAPAIRRPSPPRAAAPRKYTGGGSGGQRLRSPGAFA